MPLGGKKDAAKKCVCAAGCGSVFAGQQQRGEAAIPFGDDPKLQVARDLVGREQTILTGLQRGVVLPSIAVVQVALIAMKMAAPVRRGVEPALSDQLVVAGGPDHLPGRTACRSEERTVGNACVSTC